MKGGKLGRPEGGIYCKPPNNRGANPHIRIQFP
jgi:hypothetical protein